MQDTTVTVPLSDGKHSQCTLTGGWRQRLALHIHGFGEVIGNTLADRARSLVTHGISQLQVGLYGWRPETRNTSDTDMSLKMHARDVCAVMEHAKSKSKEVKELHLVAHSMGAFVAIMAAEMMPEAITSVVLWDGSDPTKSLYTEEDFNLSPAGYLVRPKGVGIVLSQAYLESIRDFRLEPAGRFAKAGQAPALLINAGKSPLVETAEIYGRFFPHHRRIVIPGVPHSFLGNDESTAALMEQTANWINGGFRAVVR